MTKRVVPMIPVPDVAATVACYRDIGFTVDEAYGIISFREEDHRQ